MKAKDKNEWKTCFLIKLWPWMKIKQRNHWCASSYHIRKKLVCECSNTTQSSVFVFISVCFLALSSLDSLSWTLIIWHKNMYETHRINQSQQNTKFNPTQLRTFWDNSAEEITFLNPVALKEDQGLLRKLSKYRIQHARFKRKWLIHMYTHAKASVFWHN